MAIEASDARAFELLQIHIMISILHPSRGRPKQSFETIKKWILKADYKDIEIIVSLDKSDPNVTAYCELYNLLDTRFRFLIEDNKSAVEAINRAARIAQGNIMIVVSDDSDCPARWATRLLKCVEGKTDFVLKVRDGIQPKMITQPILDRAYYQRDGYIYHPAFSHAWCDRYFTEVAHKRKRVITKNLMFRHLHYSALKKKPDAQYQRTDATFDEGKKIYKQLMESL